MRNRFFASIAIMCVLLTGVGLSTDTRPKAAKKRAVNRLGTLLPASDGVAVFDAKRFFGDALPRVLAANQPLLGDITSKVAEFQTRTGIDLRKFDQAAVGVRYRQLAGKDVDYEPVVIASGEIDFDSIVAAAKTASKGDHRTEMVGSRTMFIFTAKDLVQKPGATNSTISGIANDITSGFAKEVALAGLDRTTIIVGTPARVRETLEGKSRIGADVLALLPARDASLVSFAVRTHGGMAKLLPLDNDELGRTIESIQFFTGWADSTAAGTSLQLMARTQRAEQAEQLKDTLDVVRIMGKGLLGASKATDKQIYGRMLSNLRLTHRGTDVVLDLTVPQADIDALIATIKVK
jgi:hypothetical protein